MPLRICHILYTSSMTSSSRSWSNPNSPSKSRKSLLTAYMGYTSWWRHRIAPSPHLAPPTAPDPAPNGLAIFWIFFTIQRDIIKAYCVRKPTLFPSGVCCAGVLIYIPWSANKIRRFRLFNWKFQRIFVREKLLFRIINSIWKFLSSRLRGNRRNSTFSTIWYSAHRTPLADLSFVYFNLHSCFYSPSSFIMSIICYLKAGFQTFILFFAYLIRKHEHHTYSYSRGIRLAPLPLFGTRHSTNCNQRHKSFFFFFKNQKKCSLPIHLILIPSFDFGPFWKKISLIANRDRCKSK